MASMARWHNGQEIGMIQKRVLDGSYLPNFRQLLFDGLAFGPLLPRLIDLEKGALSVWVPESLPAVLPSQLETDVFHGLHGVAEIRREVGLYLGSRIDDGTDWLLLGETYHLATEPPPEKDRERFIWATVSSALPVYVGRDSPIAPAVHKFRSVCMRTRGIDLEGWDSFTKKLKEYPSIALIARPPADLDLKSSEFSELAGEPLFKLLRSTHYILVGVFDEMSMMLWERNPSAKDESSNVKE